MTAKKNELIVPDEIVMGKIYNIRESKVMLDIDLAELYEVETKYLKRQVRRNIDRFPEDFMFELNKEEFENLRCQNGTSSYGTSSWGGSRYMPMAFTEQGVAMLSSVLNSTRAIQVNIQIIRIFTRMREVLFNYQDVLLKIEHLEKQTLQDSDDVKVIFSYLKQLLISPEQAQRRRIGFRRTGEE